HTRWPRDWSSDVCSSDLSGCAGFEHDRPAPRVEYRPGLYHGAAQPEQARVAEHGAAARHRVALPEQGAEVLAEQLLERGDEVVRSEERRVGKECGAGCAW